MNLNESKHWAQIGRRLVVKNPLRRNAAVVAATDEHPRRGLLGGVSDGPRAQGREENSIFVQQTDLSGQQSANRVGGPGNPYCFPSQRASKLKAIVRMAPSGSYLMN